MKKLILLFLCFVGVQGIYILNHTTATLSEARGYLAATASENLVFFAGGAGKYGISNRVDIYNITSNTWTTATLSEARYELAAAASNNLVFFAGGSNQSGVFRDIVDIYNITSNTWTTATLSEARGYLAAAATENLVFFAGGINQSTFFYDIVDIYNITSSTWTTATLSEARCELAAVASNSLVFFAGGIKQSAFRNIVDIYNITSNIWTTATLSEARGYLAAAASNNLVFFAGGINITSSSNRVDIYNITSNIWTNATLSEARYGLAATASNNLVFFAGGMNITSSSNRVDIYNITSNIWTNATLSEARYDLAAAASNNLVFFAGGKNQYIPSDRVDIFYVVDSTDIENSTIISLLTGFSSSPYSGTSSSSTSPNSFNPPIDSDSFNSSIDSDSFNSSIDSDSFNPSIDPSSSENSIEYSSSEHPVLLIVLSTTGFITVLLAVILIILLINKHKKNKSQKVQNQLYTSSESKPTEIYLKNDRNNSSEPIVELDPIEELKDINSTIANELTINTQATLTTNTIQGTTQTINSTVNILSKSQVSYSDLLFDKSLGKGAFGEVFFGYWRDIPVAMKVCKSKSKLEEFLHEMKLITKLPPHPNVVQVYGVCLDNVKPVIVMEYCQNGSLDNIIYKQNLDRKKIFNIIKQIANGMLHIHKHNIVHCDLAARNILLTSSFHAKISDFGMAKVLEKTGCIRGSNMLPALWCSPETLRSGIFTKKSDVWSFGITVYEIISGNEPFHDSQDIVELVKSIRDSSLTPEIPDNCPQEIGDLLKMCWTPESRRPGFEEICKFLNSLDS
jgi:predicted Ser/Thr protein kinase